MRRNGAGDTGDDIRRGVEASIRHASIRRLGRVSYRSLKRQFDLDDAYVEDLKEGLFYTHFERIEEDGYGFR